MKHNTHAPANPERRALLKGMAGAGGIWCLGIGLAVGEPGEGAGAVRDITAWVAVHPDDRVVIRIPQTELGQGVTTSLAQLVAEEMELAWGEFETEFFDPQRNRIEHGVYVHTATLNSWSADRLFTPMREAGARIRQLLIQAGAEAMDVEVGTLTVKACHIVHAPSGRSVGFGALAARAAALAGAGDSGPPRLKSPDTWRLIGHPVPRLDSTAKTRGEARFGIDTVLPGMKYAAVRQSPVFGGKLHGFDASRVLERPGVHKVVAINAGPTGYTVPDTLWDLIDWGMDDAVAVIADHWWVAEQALADLPITWDEGVHAGTDSEAIAQSLARALTTPGRVTRDVGDVEAALAGSATRIEAEYRLPYMDHAPMEPMNCTARVDPDGVEIWAPTQYADEALRVAGYAAQVPLKDVRVHLTLAGGGFGRRLSNDFVSQAVQVAKAMPGVPIKLIHSREEDLRRGYYAPVSQARLSAGLDADGRVVAWKSHVAYGRAPFQPYGHSRVPWALPALRTEYTTVDTPAPFGWMRGVAHTQSLWMNQAFVGELAREAGRRSLDVLRELLDEGRLPADVPDREDALFRIRRQRRLLEEVVHLAGGEVLEGAKRGRGFAVTDMSYVPGYRSSCIAMAVEVVLDGTPAVRAERVVAVVDCGLAINPRTVEGQVEGGILYGLSNALHARITLRNGRVEQGNFDDYPLLRIGAAPIIEVHLRGAGAMPTGVGEEPVPVVMAALVDAVHAAGGGPVRALPLLGAASGAA